jgi:hypothetical protein
VPSFVTSPLRRGRAVFALPAAALAVMAVAGCGGGGSSAAGATSAAPTSAAAAAAGSGGTAANGFAAYTACLAKNGVTLPSGRPGGGTGARPSGAAGASRVPGGGGGFGGLSTSDPKTAAALKACASVRPTGGFGGAGGGANSSAIASQLTAYTSCLSDHGVTLPTPAARPSGTPAPGASGAAGRRSGGGLGGIGALNTADPKTAAAVKACAALRPTFPQGGGAGTGAPAVSATPSA